MNEEQHKRGDLGEEDEKEEQDPKIILGVFSRESLTMLGVGVGVVALLGIITIASVVVTSQPGKENINNSESFFLSKLYRYALMDGHTISYCVVLKISACISIIY